MHSPFYGRLHRNDEPGKSAPFENLDLLDNQVAFEQSESLAEHSCRAFAKVGSGEPTGSSPQTSCGTVYEWSTGASPRWTRGTRLYRHHRSLDTGTRQAVREHISVLLDDGDVIVFAPPEFELSRLAEIDHAALDARMPGG